MFESITGMTVNEAGILYENGEVWSVFMESVTLETCCRKHDSIKCGAIYRTSALSSESAPTRKCIRCALAAEDSFAMNCCCVQDIMRIQWILMDAKPCNPEMVLEQWQSMINLLTTLE